MNKLITLFLVLFCATAYGQSTTKTIKVDNYFHGVEINAPFEVEIKKGAPAVVATIDPDLASKVKFQYTPMGILKVTTTKGITINKSRNVMKLSIHTDKLDRIEGSSASRIQVESIFSSPTLDIELSSAAAISGSFIIEGKAEIECSSASSADLKVEAMNIAVDCSSASKLDLEGKCTRLDIEASSAAKVDAKSCNALEAKVEATGAASVVVQAQEKFWLEAGGASKISYLGKGEVISMDSSGASRISKR